MKLATIGRGAIVDQAYRSFEDLEGITPVAVYSRTMEQAEEFAKKHNVPQAFDDLDTMLASPDIDTVYIASPNSLHVPQARKALEAGKNVILEKPFAATVKEGKELFELAEKNGVMIFEAITSIHTPNFGLLKDNLYRVGQIRECVFNFSQYSRKYARYMEGIVDNVFNPEMDGGALMDINIYNIHLAVALFGKPQSVHYTPLIGWNGIDSSGVLLMVYPDKIITAIGSKDSSCDYLAAIQGETGTLRISKGSTGKMEYVDFVAPATENQNPEPEQISIDQGLHMTYEFMDFLTALNENNQEMYQAYKEETLAALEILEQARAQIPAYQQEAK